MRLRLDIRIKDMRQHRLGRRLRRMLFQNGRQRTSRDVGDRIVPQRFPQLRNSRHAPAVQLLKHFAPNYARRLLVGEEGDKLFEESAISRPNPAHRLDCSSPNLVVSVARCQLQQPRRGAFRLVADEPQGPDRILPHQFVLMRKQLLQRLDRNLADFAQGDARENMGLVVKRSQQPRQLLRRLRR